jgi:hypothetical protein
MTEITIVLSDNAFGEIAKRQIERRASVALAHRQNTVWCCSSEAEECFDDLETLFRGLRLVEP